MSKLPQEDGEQNALSGDKYIFWFPRGERYQMMIQVIVKGGGVR